MLKEEVLIIRFKLNTTATKYQMSLRQCDIMDSDTSLLFNTIRDLSHFWDFYALCVSTRINPISQMTMQIR